MSGLNQEIILQAAQGNKTAFEEIYKETSGFVYNVARRMLNSREDAQEITQDVFVTVFDRLKDFRFESSLRTWLYRITVNRSLNRLKTRNKEAGRNISYEDAIKTPEMEEKFKTTQETSLAADNETVVKKMLEALNPDQRACVILRNIENLSYQEIADTLKININTVRTRLKRAREKLLMMKKESLI